MAETACVMHTFTFPSYQAKQDNMNDGLQDSVSFGRFATESLSWDVKWSPFPNKRYVEEAAKQSQPGLVAKKKAFFEAYHKKKALLEQENGAEDYIQELDSEVGDLNSSVPSSKTSVLVSLGNDSEHMILETSEGAASLADAEEKGDMKPSRAGVPSDLLVHKNVQEENMLTETRSCGKVSGTDPDTAVILPVCPPEPPSFASALSHRSYSSTRSKSTRNHTRQEVTTTVTRDFVTSSMDSSETSSKNFIKYTSVYPAGDLTKVAPPAVLVLESPATSQPEMKRAKTRLMSSASGGRPSKSDWVIFPRKCLKSSSKRSEAKLPIISSPFNMRTGKEADRKREKLEEKLKSKTIKKLQLQTKIKDKAVSQLKKLRQSFCFHSGPSPDFHKENKQN